MGIDFNKTDPYICVVVLFMVEGFEVLRTLAAFHSYARTARVRKARKVKTIDPRKNANLAKGKNRSFLLI